MFQITEEPLEDSQYVTGWNTSSVVKPLLQLITWRKFPFITNKILQPWLMIRFLLAIGVIIFFPTSRPNSTNNAPDYTSLYEQHGHGCTYGFKHICYLQNVAAGHDNDSYVIW